jgi:excisionase family DNA binding protein
MRLQIHQAIYYQYYGLCLSQRETAPPPSIAALTRLPMQPDATQIRCRQWSIPSRYPIVYIDCIEYIVYAKLQRKTTMAPTLTNPISIPEKQAAQIRDLRQLIQAGDAKLVGSDGRQIPIPKTVHDLLLVILNNLSAGKTISIVPEHRQLTTQSAANILGVSRVFLVGLLENGEIPFHLVGTHRRIYLRDLLGYKRRRDAARHVAIDNMAKAEMEAGTYDKVVLPEGAADE